MQPAGLSFKKLILVCTNVRDNGMESCGDKGTIELHKKIKDAVKAIDPGIRVSRTGCLGNCLTGPSVVIMPDNIWLGGFEEKDIPLLLDHLQGKPLDMEKSQA